MSAFLVIMPQPLIRLSEALDIIDQGVVFSIQFKTADKKKQTGGKTIAMLRAIKANEKPWDKTKRNFQSSEQKAESRVLLKDPRHYKNSTRNIKAEGTQNVRKVHVRLITHFNGKKVIWG